MTAEPGKSEHSSIALRKRLGKDMVNFGPRDTVPEKFAGRQLLAHNPSVTLMRTNVVENAQLGRILAEKLNHTKGFAEVHVPARGFSPISVQGGPFHCPAADQALVSTLREHLAPHIPLRVHDLAINDPGFAEAVLAALGRGLAVATKGPDGPCPHGLRSWTACMPRSPNVAPSSGAVPAPGCPRSARRRLASTSSSFTTPAATAWQDAARWPA